jgi:enoyl-CoA hydratase/carnithine racemase
LQLLGEIGRLIDEVAADDDVRVLIVDSADPEFFIAHADVGLILDLPTDDVSVHDELSPFHAVMERFRTLPKATIAVIEGIARGGGSEFAMAFDMRYAELGKARFGQPEVAVGIIPGGGGTQRLPRLVGPARAKDMIFTGRMVLAAEARDIGLVDHVAPDESVYAAALDLVQRYTAGPALALRAAKQAIDAGLGVDLATGLDIERVQFAALFATGDQREGMRSFLENGPGQATFTGR